MSIHKNKIIFGLIAAVVLIVAFFCGGSMSNISDGQQDEALQTESEALAEAAFSQQGENKQNSGETELTENEAENGSEFENETNASDLSDANQNKATDQRLMTAEEKMNVAEKLVGDASEYGDEAYSEQNGMDINPSTGKDQYNTEAVPEGRPVPVEPEASAVSDNALTCTLSVRCDTILNNMDRLDKEKVELVPKNGIIFPEQTVTFYEGESVFNLLLREMKKNKIHLEFQNVPLYNSAYVEGISNLYEFDCGELSGWRYSVNGWFPGYGCSRYRIEQGDRVEWIYTCDLGADIGAGKSFARTGEAR